MLKYMLDTNICIFTIKHKPPHVRETFNQHSDQLCISTVTLMELVYGAEKFSITTPVPLTTVASCVASWPKRAHPSAHTIR